MPAKSTVPLTRIHFHVPVSEKARLDEIFGDSHLRSAAFRQVFTVWLASLEAQLAARERVEAET